MTEANRLNENLSHSAKSTTIRSQLLWASIFPLAFFGLLTILLSYSAIHNIALQLILQRDTALAQVAAVPVEQNLLDDQTVLQNISVELGPVSLDQAAGILTKDLALFDAGVVYVNLAGQVLAAAPGYPNLLGSDYNSLSCFRQVVQTQQPCFGSVPSTQSHPVQVAIAVPVLQKGGLTGMLIGFLNPEKRSWFQNVILPEGSNRRIYLVDVAGTLLAFRSSGLSTPDTKSLAQVTALIQKRQADSLLADSNDLDEQAVFSFAPLPTLKWGIILEEPYQAVISPADYYEAAVAGVMILGIIFSLIMLSISIERVIRPLASLSQNADRLGPGSIFYPVPEQGPEELRTLINAFNQMVIRLAEQQAALRQYAEKALLSQEEERQRISHELHDETVQELVGLIQRVELCRNEMERDPWMARRRLDELKALAEQALDDLRRISNALRPTILQDLGLSAALQTLCDDLSQELPDAHLDYEVDGQSRRLPPEQELAIFRVAQEAISNIRWHAGDASHIEIILHLAETGLNLAIRDDGPGFVVGDVRDFVRAGHLGLAGMFERARLFGGSLDIQSSPGRGTLVSLSLPYQVEIIPGQVS
jgi:two-component system, NarL family, sensor histidine kinase UhpB